MSSEDETTDCLSSLFGDDDKISLLKQQQQQQHRSQTTATINNSNRQRVDAGEPRNSYTAIPNFSARSAAALMSSGAGGLYSAIFSQQSQNFSSLFPANYAPAKMLNELLGRQVKQAQDAANASDVLNQMESAQNNNNNNNNNNSAKMDFDGSVVSHQQQPHNDGSQSPITAANDLAHHMLRNILQGKKDLMALDAELRQQAACNGVQDRHTPTDTNQNTIMNKNNNNNLMNNNNNLMSNNNYDVVQKSDSTNNIGGSGSMPSENGDCVVNELKSCDDRKNEKLHNGTNNDDHEGSCDGKKDEAEIIDDDIIMGALNDGNSLSSPGSVNNVKLKEELMDGEMMDKDLCQSPSPCPSASNKSEHGSTAMDMKRARVENIVSTIHSSPALGSTTSSQQPQVNGCKKRKLYHPQQHDNSAVERYATGLSMGLNLHNLMLNDDDDEDEMEPNIHQKRVEKRILKSQLRSMKQQLAEMQQTYVQLYNRMEQHSETTDDVDDGTSDLVDDDMMREKRSPSMGSVQQQRTPTASPIKDMPVKVPSQQQQQQQHQQVSHAQSMLNQMMSKMMSAKMHHPSPFNGAHPLLQHMQQHQQQTGSDQVGHVQHPAFSNAAAMYLSQKLLIEQEARMAKEAEERNQKHQQEMMQQQQQQQQQKAHNEMMAAREQHQQAMHQQQNHQTSSNIPQIKTSPQQQQQQQQPPKSITNDLMMRANAVATAAANSIGSGSDLEGLADILKTEINASLSTLVDSIVSRFVHQRRMVCKQNDQAAQAAEQLNKDLLMASQILDRKSPRTKSSGNDHRQPPSGNNNINQQQGNGANMNQQAGNAINNSTTNSSSNNNTNPNHHIMAPSNVPMNPIHHHQHHLAQSMMSQSNGGAPQNVPSSNNGQPVSRHNGTQPFPSMGNHVMAGVPSGSQPMVNGPCPDPSQQLSSLTQMQSLNLPPSHVRPSPTAGMFQGPPKAPTGQSPMNSVAAAALYNSIAGLNSSGSGNPFCMPEAPSREQTEQNEALSLVVTPKKKRHKVTDTRITPRTVSRILAQDALAAAQQNHMDQRQEQQQQQNNNHQQQQQVNGNGPSMQNGQQNKSFGGNMNSGNIKPETPSPRGNYHHQPPSMMPVSLPTSVAIPNPSLHESQVFSPYSPFFNPHGPPHGPQSSQLHHMHMSSSPPGISAMMDPRDSPPLPHPPTMLHPALLAAAHHGASPDYAHIRAAMDANDRNSDCNSADISYDGMQPTISFSNAFLKQLK